MGKIFEFAQHEICTAKSEWQAEHLLQQSGISEIDPDIRIADINQTHALSSEPRKLGSRVLTGLRKSSAARDLVINPSASPQNTNDSKRCGGLQGKGSGSALRHPFAPNWMVRDLYPLSLRRFRSLRRRNAACIEMPYWRLAINSSRGWTRERGWLPKSLVTPLAG
ncbi:hypothetical protein D3C80_1628750 [compost metagenome]